MPKRDIFAELTEGFDALADAHAGKKTLRTHKVTRMTPLEVTAAEIVALREKLNFSRGVFAARIRVNERTLESWEQGRAKPNSQASLLIRLVEQFPDTLGRLETLI
jgi:putative transcriptional regulator